MDANTTSPRAPTPPSEPEREFPKTSRESELRSRIAELEAAEAGHIRAARAAASAGLPERFDHFARAESHRKLRELYLEEVFLLRLLDEVRGRQADAAVEFLIEREAPG